MIADRHLTESPIEGKQVFNGHLLRVEHWQVRLPDGNTGFREIVRHKGAVAVVPVDELGCVTLVRQYRFAIERLTWEIPAGKLDHEDENPLDAARRELEEETGLRAATWTLLTTIDTTPGFCDEQISIYLATGLTQHQPQPDDDEFLSVSRIPLDQAVLQVMTGELKDSKTIIGLLMAQKVLSKFKENSVYPLTNIKRTRSTIPSMSEK